jgi:hydroxyacylglutathione hydrolase
LIVEQIWTGNAWRNFNYLIACSETGEALAVDPLDHDKCLRKGKVMGWDINQVLNTHEHGDHTGGNQAMITATNARLLAHAGAGIPGVDIGLVAGDLIRVGKTVELEVLDTPGHTMSHVCLLSHAEEPALFSGDTLFNAGAGNCHNGGHPEQLFDTFVTQLSQLPDNTSVYPGHDYWVNNLAFTLDREPDNETANQLLDDSGIKDPNRALVSTLGLEREVNTFFRLQNPSVIRTLRESFPDLPEQPEPKEVFLKLRELRNRW